jgi:hypothetical protein
VTHDVDALRAAARAKLDKQQAKVRKVLSAMRALEATLGPAQAAVVTSKAKRITLDGSRQSGKSRSLVARYIRKGFSKKCRSLYVAPTSKAARNAVWRKFYEINDEFGFGIEMHEGIFEARFPNGSVVGFEGAHDKARVQRLRGDTIDGMLGVDETAFFPDPLVRELLGPVASSMFLTTEQDIVLASSPGLQRRGKFFELVHDTSGDWEHHRLTAHDNPAIKDPLGALADLRAANAWTETTPAYMREGLGLWVDDATYNVYDLTELNLIDELPVGPYETIMLIDFGKNDQSSIAVAGWREHDPTLYVLYVQGWSDLDIKDICEKAEPLIKRFAPLGIYGDSGGGGAQHMDYMRKRAGIPIRPVSKRQNYKKPAIDALNADMRRGHYKVLRSSPLVDQMQALQWDPVEVGKGHWTEHPSMPNDLCDTAGVYAHVQARHYRAEAAPEAEPEVGSDAHWKRYREEGLRHASQQASAHHVMLEQAAEEHAMLTGGDWAD